MTTLTYLDEIVMILATVLITFVHLSLILQNFVIIRLIVIVSGSNFVDDRAKLAHEFNGAATHQTNVFADFVCAETTSINTKKYHFA